MPFIPLPPPPAGIQTPTDDWTDDPSFDLSRSPSLINGFTSSPPKRSHHSRSHSLSSSSSSRGSGGIVASPLRNVHTSEAGLGRRNGIEEEMSEDGFDFPEGLDEVQGGTMKRESRMPASGSSGIGISGLKDALKRNSAGSGSDFPDDLIMDDEDEDKGATLTLKSQSTKPVKKGMGTISLSGTVIGVGPKGIGTITRLGSATSSSGSTIKLSSGIGRTAPQPDFDMDDLSGFDDDIPTIPPSSKRSFTSSSGLILPSPSIRVLAHSNALDNLDFDFDDELDAVGEDEDQATLKAGATIKALLPPPRSKPSSSATLKSSRPKSTTSLPLPDEDTESDLLLPLSMTNLTLATSRQSSTSAKLLKPRASTSTIRSDWDSPSSGSGKTRDDSPWGKKARPSETSGTSTSISDQLATPLRKGRVVDVEVEGEEEGEDMMMDLVLPEAGFFEGKREGELNRILDTKRKPQHAFVSPKGKGKVESKGVVDESMEDGLLFEEKELTGHRLRQQKKVRGLAGGTIKKGSIGKEGGKAALSWEQVRETGWGRHTPLPTKQDRGSGGLGLAGMSSTGSGVAVGHRSHSATASSINPSQPLNNRDFSSPSGFAPTPSSSNRQESTRSRTQSMAPPPIPSSIPTTPSSRLRHQKSHYQIPPPSPTPPQSLHRKQSLASLQDALGSHPPLPESDRSVTPHKERYHSSTSRLTMGTSSSRAKVRHPISAIFPRPESGSGLATQSSSSSISGLARGPTLIAPRSKPVQVQTQMVIPLGGRKKGLSGEKRRNWGDGTELEGIEDLAVDETPKSGMSDIGLGKPRGKGDSYGRSAVPPPKAVIPSAETEKRKKSTGGSVSKRRPRKAAGLIKHLGPVDKKKVIGDMTWNPATLRWEGNESILRDFDSIPSGTPTSSSAPARPALITHYTGGVVPIPSSTPTGTGHSLTASTIRIVGDMQFDPEKMCWVSLGDEEPDPFADMADDEDDEGGNTITRATARKFVSVGQGLGASAGSGWSSRLASESSAGGSVISWEERVKVREADRRTGAGFVSGGDGEGDVTEALWRECKDAEERHRKEMKGWGGGLSVNARMSSEEKRDRERREEKRLWEIRYLAMRS